MMIAPRGVVFLGQGPLIQHLGPAGALIMDILLLIGTQRGLRGEHELDSGPSVATKLLSDHSSDVFLLWASDDLCLFSFWLIGYPLLPRHRPEASGASTSVTLTQCLLTQTWNPWPFLAGWRPRLSAQRRPHVKQRQGTWSALSPLCPPSAPHRAGLLRMCAQLTRYPDLGPPQSHSLQHKHRSWGGGRAWVESSSMSRTQWEWGGVKAWELLPGLPCSLGSWIGEPWLRPRGSQVEGPVSVAQQ